MKTVVHVWGAIIALLLAANTFLTYRSALEYGQLSMEQMTPSEWNKCMDGKANQLTDRHCKRGWYLKGSHPYPSR